MGKAMTGLNDKQERFVDEYLKDLNATQAAIRAGYSEKTAYSMGQRLLKKVEIQKAIQQRQKARERRTEITQDRVLRELAAVGFANGTDYTRIAPDGAVELMETDSLTEAQRAAITGIRQTRDGVEVKLADKMKALELLGKHLGMFSGNGADLLDVEDDPLTKSIDEVMRYGPVPETDANSDLSEN